MNVRIRPYEPSDERAWLECRVLAFLDTAYFDSVEREKERYVHPAIELVAEADATIVGLLDVECEEVPGSVCSERPGLAGMIWHLAVHPRYRRHGIATRLLADAEAAARERGLERFEAWTRDDDWVRCWYESRGFSRITSYLHVYPHGREELAGVLRSEIPELKPVLAFAHYTGEARDEIAGRFARVHECVLYERRFGG